MKKKLSLKLATLYIAFFAFILSLFSCNISEIGNITENVYYNPSFSFPVGSDEFTLENAVDEYPGGIVRITDTLNIQDTVETFWYDNLIYYIPGYLDYYFETVFSLSDITQNIDYINSLTIRTNARNEIPASTYVQVYFMDGAGVVLDSLYHEGLLAVEAAETDADGNLIESGTMQEDTPLTESQIDILPQVTRIQVFGRIIPVNYQNSGIRYFSFQNFWLQLGFRIELEMPLNEI